MKEERKTEAWKILSNECRGSESYCRGRIILKLSWWQEELVPLHLQIPWFTQLKQSVTIPNLTSTCLYPSLGWSSDSWKQEQLFCCKSQEVKKEQTRIEFLKADSGRGTGSEMSWEARTRRVCNLSTNLLVTIHDICRWPWIKRQLKCN